MRYKIIQVNGIIHVLAVCLGYGLTLSSFLANFSLWLHCLLKVKHSKSQQTWSKMDFSAYT